MLGNSRLLDLFTVALRGQLAALASDHKPLAFVLSARHTSPHNSLPQHLLCSEPLPPDRSAHPTVSLRLPKHVYRNRHTASTATSILLAAIAAPATALGISAGSVGLAVFSTLVYRSYTTAHAVHSLGKPVMPAYVRIFRLFRSVTERFGLLLEQRRWLRARRYIYNLTSGRDFHRGVLASRLLPRVRRQILDNRSNSTTVQATPETLRTHFSTCFNRPLRLADGDDFITFLQQVYTPLPHTVI